MNTQPLHGYSLDFTEIGRTAYKRDPGALVKSDLNLTGYYHDMTVTSKSTEVILRFY